MEGNEEIWKDVIGYEGLYHVSNFGNVKALKKTINYLDGRIQTYKEYILKNSPMKIGYLIVTLTKNKSYNKHYVHRLVAEAFIPNLENKPQVNHINGIRINNNFENLEWVTNRENTTHGYSSKSEKLIGVQYVKKTNLYKCAFWHEGKVKYLGMFKTEQEAHNTYLNFLKENNITNKYSDVSI